MFTWVAKGGASVARGRGFGLEVGGALLGAWPMVAMGQKRMRELECALNISFSNV